MLSILATVCELLPVTFFGSKILHDSIDADLAAVSSGDPSDKASSKFETGDTTFALLVRDIFCGRCPTQEIGGVDAFEGVEPPERLRFVVLLKGEALFEQGVSSHSSLTPAERWKGAMTSELVLGDLHALVLGEGHKFVSEVCTLHIQKCSRSSEELRMIMLRYIFKYMQTNKVRFVKIRVTYA